MSTRAGIGFHSEESPFRVDGCIEKHGSLCYKKGTCAKRHRGGFYLRLAGDLMRGGRKYFYSADFLIRAIFLLLIALDFVLTVIATNAGFIEINPYLKAVVNNSWDFLLIKSMAVLIAIAVPAKLLAPSFIPSIIFMVFVLAWNIKELLL